jgi:hypothetical protein
MCPAVKDLSLESEWESKEYQNIIQVLAETIGLTMNVV